MPAREAAAYQGYYNASPERWAFYIEVLAAEFGNAVLFGQVHMLTVDKEWPHFPPPRDPGSLTVYDVALSGSVEDHMNNVRAWAGSVWKTWSEHHTAVAMFVSRHVTPEQVRGGAWTGRRIHDP